jgi:hypothetical protein
MTLCRIIGDLKVLSSEHEHYSECMVDGWVLPVITRGVTLRASVPSRARRSTTNDRPHRVIADTHPDVSELRSRTSPPPFSYCNGSSACRAGLRPAWRWWVVSVDAVVELISDRFSRVERRRRVGAYLRSVLAGLGRWYIAWSAHHRRSASVLQTQPSAAHDQCCDQ